MTDKEIINWLLEGDVSIQYQVHRDLLDSGRNKLQHQIENTGWGAKFLSKRNSSGHWGIKFYQPKWTSSHYTLLDLRNLCISPDIPVIKDSINLILSNLKGQDGGILPIGQDQKCDVCLNGMFLNYASYFKMAEKKLQSIIDFILAQRMSDGGFNCRFNRFGAKHSSLHSTLSVLEGITEYEYNGFKHRLSELIKTKKSSVEFILGHRLFKSDKTGEIIDKKMIKLSYPSRWRYDILRALDYFRYAKVNYDERMHDAIEVLVKKRTADNIWKLQTNHPGQFHFHMEQVGKPSRWNTLRALRVLKYFNVPV